MRIWGKIPSDQHHQRQTSRRKDVVCSEGGRGVWCCFIQELLHSSSTALWSNNSFGNIFRSCCSDQLRSASQPEQLLNTEFCIWTPRLFLASQLTPMIPPASGQLRPVLVRTESSNLSSLHVGVKSKDYKRKILLKIQILNILLYSLIVGFY